MRRIDRIKLTFTRNWQFPGKERLSTFFKPSIKLRQSFHEGITWLTNENIAIHTNADSYIEWSIMSGGTYEDEIGKLIRISLSAGDNCLDIGANIGLQSIRMAQCIGPRGRVYAFEPLAHLRYKLSANTCLNSVSNVTLMPFALSDEESEGNFSVDRHAWNQGTFSIHEQNIQNSELVMIKVADDLPEIQALTQLALIKIDVEGYEFQVLRGLANSIKRHMPRIIFEYDANYWSKTSQSIVACSDFLRALDYALFQITPAGCMKIDKGYEISSGNIFCLPRQNA